VAGHRDGWGGWQIGQRRTDRTWAAYLLAVERDDPTSRTHGWLQVLRSRPEIDAFAAGVARLQSMVVDDVPCSLVHNDLMNRNVHVDVSSGRVAGVFDWGCALNGDHLYDPCLIEFWMPWYPNLSAQPLWAALAQRWAQVGYEPAELARRRQACWLRIGLEHIAWNAHLRHWDDCQRVADRMIELTFTARDSLT
jgi:hygromycin-B 4-O-kinase